MHTRKLFTCLALLLLLAAAGAAQAQDDAAAESVQDITLPDVDAPEPPDSAAAVSPGGGYDMQACVERGLEANPTILAARSQLTGSESGIKSARGDFLFSATAGYTWSHQDRQPKTAGQMVGDQDGWAFNLNLSQPLFTGFRLLSSYQRAKLYKQQSEAMLTNAEISLIQAIQSNFLGLLKARMEVKSAEDSVQRLESQYKVTQAFYDVGLKPRVDVLQAEVDLAEAEQSLLSARNTVDTQMAQLNTLLNLPLQADVQYVGQLSQRPFDMTLEQCLARAYDNRPDLAIGKKSVEMAMEDADIVAADYYPQVSAEYNYNRAGDDVLGDSKHLSHSSAESWEAGIGVSWEFWQWGSTYYAHDQATETVRQMQSELEDTRLNAGYEVKSSLLALNDAAKRIDVAKKSVQAAKESYRMAVARYQAQVGTNNDVLDAQARVTSSESGLINALADYETALADLYAAMGVKNPTLNPM